MSKKTISIKIASDVVCPWCYVGKKELEKMMDELKDEFHFDIQYLPFELAPDMSTEGEDFQPYITKKFGDWDKFLTGTKFLVERGQGIGIDFDFEHINRSPNTFNLHRIIQFAHQFGLQAVVKEAYMKAYFEQQIDLTNSENVVRIAVENGIDEDLLYKLLGSDEGSNEIRIMQDSLRSMGVSGVPFFIINNEYGLSGAVPAAQLKEAVIDVASKIA